jgi:hypothetical protein
MREVGMPGNSAVQDCADSIDANPGAVAAILAQPSASRLERAGKRFGGSFGIGYGEGLVVRGAAEFAVIALCSNRRLYLSQTV